MGRIVRWCLSQDVGSKAGPCVFAVLVPSARTGGCGTVFESAGRGGVPCASSGWTFVPVRVGLRAHVHSRGSRFVVWLFGLGCECCGGGEIRHCLLMTLPFHKHFDSISLQLAVPLFDRCTSAYSFLSLLFTQLYSQTSRSLPPFLNTSILFQKPI